MFLCESVSSILAEVEIKEGDRVPSLCFGITPLLPQPIPNGPQGDHVIADNFYGGRDWHS
jgi:hypothetical protein